MGRASQERRQRREGGTRQATSGSGVVNRAILVLTALIVIVGIAWTFSDSARSTPGRAASAAYKDGSPAWSPDGTRIAFYSERDGNAEIYVMNADGRDVRRLTDSPADEGYPAWSPDGKTITFDSDRDGNFEIYAMDVDGAGVRRLTDHPSRDVSATWAPDGSHIVFMSDRDGGFDVGTATFSAASHTEKVAVPLYRRLTTTGTSWFPTYSPDGSTLAFHVGRDVHVMHAGGGPLRRLTTDPANGMYPTWSPDGKRIAFMSWRNGRTELFTMNADGSGQSTLLSMERGDAIDPRWSPDGSKIAFVHMPDGREGREARIAVVDVGTRTVTPLTK